MTARTGSLKCKLEKIRKLEADVRDYKEKKELYESMLTSGSLNDEEYDYAKMKADYYQHAFGHSCDELREMKIELRKDCNVDAFGYDSPGIVDDSYYEKMFKNYGYLVGIRL